MGFETQEQAEAWAERMEIRRKEMKEDAAVSGLESVRKLNAWMTIMNLPAFYKLPKDERESMKAVFDYAWEAASKQP